MREQRPCKDKAFIAYANYSLREDPKNLLRIYDVVDRNDFFVVHSRNLKIVVDFVVAFLTCEQPKDLNCDDEVSKIALEAVYGYRDGFCETECSERGLREEKWGQEPFDEPVRLSCIECDQNHYRDLLEELTKGTPYSEIAGCLPFITLGRNFRKAVEGEIEVLPFPGKGLKDFKAWKTHDPLSLPDDRSVESSKVAFRNFWSALIAFDLSEFLYGDRANLARLKNCPFCHEFFVAKDAKKQICYSKDCKMAGDREQKRPYMEMKRDPESSEYDERYKTREFGRTREE